MHHKRRWIGMLLMAAALLRSPRRAGGRKRSPAGPAGTPREQAVSLYNEGVALMRATHYAAAQEKFEQALALDETLAEGPQ